MKESEVLNFVEKSSEEKNKMFFNRIIEKANSIERQKTLSSIGVLIVILVYYLLELKADFEVQIGPIKISQSHTLLNVFPLTLSFMVFRYIVLSAHLAELKMILKIFNEKFFGYQNSHLDVLLTDDFTRVILPFSLFEELGKFNTNKKSGCISTLTLTPILLLMPFTPLIIVGLWLYPQLVLFTSLELFNQIFLGLTVWLAIISIIYLVKTMALGIDEYDLSKKKM